MVLDLHAILEFSKPFNIRYNIPISSQFILGNRVGSLEGDFKIFEITIEKAIGTIAYCFEKQWSVVFGPLKFFFLVESQYSMYTDRRSASETAIEFALLLL